MDRVAGRPGILPQFPVQGHWAHERSSGLRHPVAQQVEPGAPPRRALDRLQAADLASTGPLLQGRPDRRETTPEPTDASRPSMSWTTPSPNGAASSPTTLGDISEGTYQASRSRTYLRKAIEVSALVASRNSLGRTA